MTPLEKLQMLERAGRVVWVVQAIDEGRIHSHAFGMVHGVHPSFKAAKLAVEARNEKSSHQWKLRPDDKFSCRWSNQPLEGWGAYYWNGWPEHSIRISPYLIGEAGMYKGALTERSIEGRINVLDLLSLVTDEQARIVQQTGQQPPEL